MNKFRQLWSIEFTAHLDLDTHAEKACVGLRMQLDNPRYPSNTPRSNARQRRREVREASGKVNNAEKASGTDEDFNDHENAPTVECDKVVLNAEVINSVELSTENANIVTERVTPWVTQPTWQALASCIPLPSLFLLLLSGLPCYTGTALSCPTTTDTTATHATSRSLPLFLLL